MAVELARRRFTTAEYYEMLRSGILTQDDRVELIEGEIVEMTPIGPKHAGIVGRLTGWFARRFGEGVHVSPQNPIDLGERSQPQPDVVVARSTPDTYTHSHPTPADILLLVEVSDTTLEYDRQVKATLYARALIPETWIFDLPGDQVLIYREPSAEGYRLLRIVRRGERIAPLAFPDVSFLVDDLIG
jgi:Uma2 family endonuclease